MVQTPLFLSMLTLQPLTMLLLTSLTLISTMIIMVIINFRWQMVNVWIFFFHGKRGISLNDCKTQNIGVVATDSLFVCSRLYRSLSSMIVISYILHKIYRSQILLEIEVPECILKQQTFNKKETVLHYKISSNQFVPCCQPELFPAKPIFPDFLVRR